MLKATASELLAKKLEAMSEKADKTESVEEYLSLVDGMLKIYTILNGADGFESRFSESNTNFSC